MTLGCNNGFEDRRRFVASVTRTVDSTRGGHGSHGNVRMRSGNRNPGHTPRKKQRNEFWLYQKDVCIREEATSMGRCSRPAWAAAGAGKHARVAGATPPR